LCMIASILKSGSFKFTRGGDFSGWGQCPPPPPPPPPPPHKHKKKTKQKKKKNKKQINPISIVFFYTFSL